MHLDGVKFPALVIADDGWVDHVIDAAELSTWTLAAVATYNKRRVVLYDSNDRAWQVEEIVPHKPISTLAKFLALTFYNPKIPVRIEVQPIVETPLQRVQEALRKAIDKDDDILTQETEAVDLKNVVGRAGSFKELVAALKKSRAIY